MKNILDTKSLVQAAAIAAVYAALTLLLEPISYGPVQLRVSEALCVLVFFTPAAVPGLFVGCLLANILGGFGLYDIVLGSLATLIAAYLGYRLRAFKWILPLPAVVVNALVVGPMLFYLYQLGETALLCIATVGVGQFLACYVLGMPLLLLMEKLGMKRLLAK